MDRKRFKLMAYAKIREMLKSIMIQQFRLVYQFRKTRSFATNTKAQFCYCGESIVTLCLGGKVI